MTLLILLVIAFFAVRWLLFRPKKPAPKTKPVAVRPVPAKKPVVAVPKEKRAPVPVPEAPAVPVAADESAPPPPETIVCLDVKTTGMGATDRIVTLAAIRWTGGETPAVLNLVFDPGRKSHAKAEKAHGFNDWVLRHQEAVGERAAEIAAFIDAGDLIVGHDIDAAVESLRKEVYAPLGRALAKPLDGTLAICRERGLDDAGLDDIAQRIGVARPKDGFRAVGDAWFTLNLYLWLRERPLPPASLPADPRPANVKEVPPQPFGPIPPRRKRSVQRVS